MKQYLGDSVYLADNGDGIVLTTENGEKVANIIYLEPEVMEALYIYLHKAIEGPQE